MEFGAKGFGLPSRFPVIIKQSVVEQLQLMRPEIEKAVKREVSKSGSVIAKALVNGLIENTKLDYKFSVNIS